MNYWKLVSGFLIGLVIVAAFHIWCNYNQPQPPSYTVLACTDAQGGMAVMGISRSIQPTNTFYWVKDGQGDWQTYRPGAFESCATLSSDEARKKGMIK